MGDPLTTIEDGQLYYDEPVYVMPDSVAQSVRDAVRKPLGKHLIEPLVVAHNRIQLRWMKPDINGKLVPR